MVPPIVGIGGSSHQLGEVRRFLQSVLLDASAAYVLVLHADPAEEDKIVSSLTDCCPLEITHVPEGSASDCACEPGHVYVTASRSLPTIEAGHLRLGRHDDARAQRAPIDRFLVSLAEDQEENAVVVILAGTGGDGTIGVRAIKVHGGIVLTQSDAESGSFMRSSPAAKFADLSLPVEKIASRLRAHFDHQDSLVSGNALAGIRADASAHLKDFCDILRLRTGHDFSGYKGGTITRQVQRRMHLLQISDSDAFVALLKAEPSEVDRLFDDLLIGLTEFFHSRQAFDTLARTIIPEILACKGPNDPLRIWVPGCATGEEAYSIAMLLFEQAHDRTETRIQVFASDIDDGSLTSARRGRYPASIAEFVSEERLRRFFVREDESYCVTGELRNRCLFTHHDFLRDPPFSQIDLIICRNVLIHLNPDLQKKVVGVLHYAMREGGYLLMGESENVTDAALFDTIDPSDRIFRKRACGSVRRPTAPISSRAPVEHHAAARSSAVNGNLVARAEQQVLEQFGPAHVIVNAHGDIIYASGRTGAYLEMPAGEPDSNVFSLAISDLRMELRAAFGEAAEQNSTVIVRNIALLNTSHRSHIDLIVQPLDVADAIDPSYLVVFREIRDVSSDGLKNAGEREETARAGIFQLEQELRRSRENLQTVTEELQSSNEELRSTNEEISSLNEELQTVNAELIVRVDELSSAINDMGNLFESTQIATIFLDRDLRLRFFTPAACDLYHLSPNDLGRQITDLRPRFTDDWLPLKASEVFRTRSPFEHLVSSTESDRIYTMRLLPYRTATDAIEGLVLTFVEHRPFSSLQ